MDEFDIETVVLLVNKMARYSTNLHILFSVVLLVNKMARY